MLKQFASKVLALAAICLFFGACSTLEAAERAQKELYVATPLTAPGSFTSGAEGPACVQMCPHGSAVRLSFREMEDVVSVLK